MLELEDTTAQLYVFKEFSVCAVCAAPGAAKVPLAPVACFACGGVAHHCWSSVADHHPHVSSPCCYSLPASKLFKDWLGQLAAKW
eukprot:6090321-Amphidinium_carterae.1